MGWVVNATPRPGRFTSGKETRNPLYRGLVGPQYQTGRVRKILPPPGFDPRTVQPVASRYTDYVVPAQLADCTIDLYIKLLRSNWTLYISDYTMLLFPDFL
jgi:hypothetical protein